MESGLRILLETLLKRRIIGAKHMPEANVQRRTKDFDKAYRKIVKEGVILRAKKRTGKGSDWHISLNPRKLKEINEMINDG